MLENLIGIASHRHYNESTEGGTIHSPHEESLKIRHTINTFTEDKYEKITRTEIWYRHGDFFRSILRGLHGPDAVAWRKRYGNVF